MALMPAPLPRADRLHVVASSAARDAEALGRDVRALPEDVDLLEVRLDRFADPFALDLGALVETIGRPALATLRSAREGGGFEGTAEEAARLLAAADEAGFAWVDLEADVAPLVPRRRARRLVSLHGAAAAEDPAGHVARLAALDADAVKIAAPFDDPLAADRWLRAAAGAAAEAGLPAAAVPMGEEVSFLRPLARRYGLSFVFCAVHPSRRTAAGQPTAADCLGRFRVRTLGPETRLYGVVGADVSRSLSPVVHNRVFEALGLDAVYLPVSIRRFEPFARLAARLPFHGLSITAPHKPEAARLADARSEDVDRLGSANTWLLREGGFTAIDTDGAGFAAALALAESDPVAARAVCVGHTLEPLERLRGDENLAPERRVVRTALVYGTGGAARAVAYALSRRGVRVAVTGRDDERARRLVLELNAGLEAITPERARTRKFDLLVKAVPDDPTGELSLDPFDFALEGFAADLVYRPRDTAFLVASRRARRVPISGLLMFSEQAVLQAAAFTGRPPAEVRPLVVEALREAEALPV